MYAPKHTNLFKILQSNKEWVVIILIFVTSLFLYSSSLNNYFYQDDFFNIKISLSQGVLESFNLFGKPILEFYAYRPLTTQLFWGLGYHFFGLNPIPFHLILFIFYLSTLLLVYQCAKTLLNSRKIGLLSLFVYAFSASHYYRLYFLSQFQEIGLAFLTLLLFYFYLKKHYKISLILLLASLCSKETAVVIPLVMAFTSLYQRILFKTARYWLFGVGIVILYILIRAHYYGFFSGGVYTYDFHLKSIINNYFWYTLWSLGVPESFSNVKVFTGGLRLNPLLWTTFGRYGPIIVSLTFALLGLITIGLIKSKNKLHNFRQFMYAISWFVVFLLPVGFFPFHKFGYSLALPLFGFSLFLAVLLGNSNRKLIFITLSLYIILSVSSLRLNLENHWSTKLSYTAKTVIDYLSVRYMKGEKLPRIFFRSTFDPVCPINNYSSSDVSHAISNGDALSLIYPGSEQNVYFEFDDKYKNFNRAEVFIDSRRFIK